MPSTIAGLGKKERERLAVILKAAPPIITPEVAAEELKLDRSKAAQLLALWCRKGWLMRLKRGVYVPVPLEAETTEIQPDEAWVVAHQLFAPCYIGGWSAAHHWELTEQLFNSTMVLTTRKVSTRDVDLNGTKIKLKTIKPSRFFGTKLIWINQHRVEISDPTKTIVDALNDPPIVGGIRMTIDILREYMRSSHKDIQRVFEYATRMGNAAIFKRLGFLTENLFPSETELLQRCRDSLKSGFAQLDPSSPGKKLITSWNLWIPDAWKSSKGWQIDNL